MPSQPDAEFGLADARRILGEVFAPWVQDLNLSVERIEHLPPPDVPDWRTLGAPKLARRDEP